MRLGEHQKTILEFYIKWRDSLGKPQVKLDEKRCVWGRNRIPTIWVRNWIFSAHKRPYEIRHLPMTPGEKASFSRSLRQLEAKGLIVCYNSVNDNKNYTTHYMLTEKGEKVFNTLTFSTEKEKLTSH